LSAGRLVYCRLKLGIQLSEAITGDGAAIFRHACGLGLEGSKRIGSRYVSGILTALDTANCMPSSKLLATRLGRASVHHLYCALLGSSAGFTYLMANGPSPAI
jgi:hypothetical protein